MSDKPMVYRNRSRGLPTGSVVGYVRRIKDDIFRQVPGRDDVASADGCRTGRRDATFKEVERSSWPDSARHVHPDGQIPDRQKWRLIGQECRGGRRTGSERERLYGDGTDSVQLGIIGSESSLPCRPRPGDFETHRHFRRPGW